MCVRHHWRGRVWHTEQALTMRRARFYGSLGVEVLVDCIRDTYRYLARPKES